MQIRKYISTDSLILLLITVVAFISHYASLQQTDFANGWDSYFYLVQTKSLLENGHLVSSRISLIYPLLAFFKIITGDYIFAWKIFSSLLIVIAVIVTFKLIIATSNNRNVALIAASLLAISPHLYYFTSQYAKNLLGFDCLLIFLLFLLQRKLILAFIFVIVNILIHKLTGGLSVVIFSSYVVISYLQRKGQVKYLFLCFIPVVLVLLFPKIFSIDELARQHDFLPDKFQFPFVNFLLEFRGYITSFWLLEICMVNIVFIALILKLIRSKNYTINYWIVPVLFFVLNIPIIKWDIEGFSFRFFLLSVLFSSIMIGFLFDTIRLTKSVTIFLVIIILSLSVFSFKSYNPKLHDPDYKKYQKLTSELVKKDVFNQTELFIVHKSFAEYIKFATDKDAMSWIPEYQIAEDSLWRIVFNVGAFQLQTVIPEERIISLNSDYLILRETDWQKILRYVYENHNDFYDDYTTWLNPNSMRPSFMQKYRRENDK